MKWPSTLADSDAVIVREETADGIQYVVHGRCGPQLMCRTYAEAEARAFDYAEHARAHAWYADGRGLQLVGGNSRRLSSPTRRHVHVTPAPNDS
jgi:hypothetical protein